CGMVGWLLILSPAEVNPRFYRIQFLATLGLTALATSLLGESAGAWVWLALAAGMTLALIGSIVWSLKHAPAGRSLVLLETVALVAALALIKSPEPAPEGVSRFAADNLSSAALL